jgi:hypothetical protein
VECAWVFDLLVGLILLAEISHVSLFALSVVFCCDFRLSNPVLYSYAVLIEIEERRVGSILGYRVSSLKKFE